MPPEQPTVVDIAAWVERARQDPVQYRERQATEVFLSAVGMSSPYGEKLYLKGGTLMGIAYDSPRQTADIDFTAGLEPTAAVVEEIRSALDQNLARATARLGYPDLVCRVQRIECQPRMFEQASFPALKVTIAYAVRGSREEQRLRDGQCPSILRVDVSFNEPVAAIQVIRLGDRGALVHAYGLVDLVAEKLRALLQQLQRRHPRYRRQDVYDLARLIKAFSLDDDERRQILAALREKGRSRGIEPQSDSLDNPEVARMAAAEWETMQLELEDLPDFDSCYAVVQDFYRSLPWDT